LDRFDLRVIVDRPEVSDLMGDERLAGPSESSTQIAARVLAARVIARRRGVTCNAELPAPDLDELVPLQPEARRLLETRLRQGRLSARGLHRVRRVARTVADLTGQEGDVRVDDVYAALALRTDVFGPEAEAG